MLFGRESRAFLFRNSGSADEKWISDLEIILFRHGGVVGDWKFGMINCTSKPDEGHTGQRIRSNFPRIVYISVKF